MRRQPSSPENPMMRRDGGGHLERRYAANLLARTRHSTPPVDEDAFLHGPRSRDELAEKFGEGFVQAATSGEEVGPDSRDDVSGPDAGGAFVETTGISEFAAGVDASNPPDAMREPFPKT